MQKLAEICIRRPVFAAMIILALVVVGAASYGRLGVDRFPSVDLPTVSVRTALPGASTEEVETEISQRIEEAVNTVEGSPGTHEGHVARISPAIREESRTLLVEAEVPNPGGRLRPGSFAKAEIVTQADEPAVLVPTSAVVSFAGIEKVIGVADGKAVEKRVKTGRRAGDRVEILEGAAAGDVVVVQPGNLVDGQPVTIIP